MQLKFERRSPVEWRILVKIRGRYWLSFSTSRTMIPVKQLRNPFAGIRYWTLQIGLLKITWRGSWG